MELIVRLKKNIKFSNFTLDLDEKLYDSLRHGEFGFEKCRWLLTLFCFDVPYSIIDIFGYTDARRLRHRQPANRNDNNWCGVDKQKYIS